MSKIKEVTRQKLSATTSRSWQDPTYRAKMIAKQRSLGYRNYKHNIYVPSR